VLQDAAGMTVCSMVTTGPGAATELMAQLDLTAVDLLLFVGGDGTVYEGLQVRGLSTASASAAVGGSLPGMAVWERSSCSCMFHCQLALSAVMLLLWLVQHSQGHRVYQTL